MTDHVRSDVANGVLTLTLNRPDKKNALTRAMYQALGEAIDGAAAAADVRCILIQAEGDVFTAGNDLGDFAAINRGEPADAARTGGNPLLVALARAVTPVVAAVNGRAVGIGTTMLLHCDLVYAAPAARFRTPFVELALVPEAGSSVLLPALVGARRAAQLLLLGETIDAKTALDWGLINGVVDDPDAAATAAAARLARSAPGALRATRALIRRADREAVREAMRVEGQVFAERLRSPEAMEAFQAFMARRPADFSRF